MKKQQCYAEGRDFEPGTLQEEDVKIVYVPIEVEEILEFTSEGESSSDEE